MAIESHSEIQPTEVYVPENQHEVINTVQQEANASEHISDQVMASDHQQETLNQEVLPSPELR